MSKLTEEACKAFEEARDVLWKNQARLWAEYNKSIAPLKYQESELRLKFQEEHSLSPSVNVEQSIADWRWKEAHGNEAIAEGKDHHRKEARA